MVVVGYGTSHGEVTWQSIYRKGRGSYPCFPPGQTIALLWVSGAMSGIDGGTEMDCRRCCQLSSFLMHRWPLSAGGRWRVGECCLDLHPGYPGTPKDSGIFADIHSETHPASWGLLPMQIHTLVTHSQDENELRTYTPLVKPNLTYPIKDNDLFSNSNN